MKEYKKNIVYEEQERIIDTQTGEVIQERKLTKSKTDREPDYIKVYYDTMLSFNGIKDIPVSFLMALSAYITYSNEGEPMRFQNVKVTRDDIVSKLQIKDSMYQKYIKRCKDAGLLIPTKYRGTFEVNPFFIAKGKWDSIKELRCSFKFIDGTWKREIEEDENE